MFTSIWLPRGTIFTFKLPEPPEAEIINFLSFGILEQQMRSECTLVSKRICRNCCMLLAGSSFVDSLRLVTGAPRIDLRAAKERSWLVPFLEFLRVTLTKFSWLGISLENVAGKRNQIQFLYLRIKLMLSLQIEKELQWEFWFWFGFLEESCRPVSRYQALILTILSRVSSPNLQSFQEETTNAPPSPRIILQ